MAKDRYADYVQRSADVAVAAMPVPVRVLEVGCGVGDLLREIATRVPYCETYLGLDVTGALARAAAASVVRLRWGHAAAAALPLRASTFDLVVADDSAAGWDDPARALAELSRVMTPGGTVVVLERAQPSPLGAVGKGEGGAEALFGAAGLRVRGREPVVRRGLGVSVHATVATR